MKSVSCNRIPPKAPCCPIAQVVTVSFTRLTNQALRDFSDSLRSAVKDRLPNEMLILLRFHDLFSSVKGMTTVNDQGLNPFWRQLSNAVA